MELIFPLSCLNCNKLGQLFCDKCSKQIKLKSFQVCFLCQKAVTKNGELCSTCGKFSESPINRIIICGKYQDELLTKAIHLFKYKFIRDLGTNLGKIQTKTLQNFSVPLPDLIIPVPLHKRRLRWRGYNQSTLLANQISIELAPGIEIPVAEDVIRRKRYTIPQVKLKKHSLRQKNISGAFELFENSYRDLKGKRVLLVDDVCTTGSTLFECAKQIRRLHPKSITAIVLARQG